MIATDKLTDGQLIDLPDEAGDAASPRFEPNEDWLRGASPVEQKTAMWRWFATHYAEPNEAVPHDGGGNFLYLDGGPYYARTVLRERFESCVPAEVLSTFIDSVEAEAGSEWAMRGIDKGSS